MVSAPPKLEVRTVGEEDFDDIFPLLELFGNAKMRRDDWRNMLFSYRWWTGTERGFALYADGVAVGFIGTIFHERSVHGRNEKFCNASSWIVREEYRTASILLLKPLLAIRDCTILNLTPTQRSYEIFSKLGFRPLESESILLPPLAPVGSFLGSFWTDPQAIAASLSTDDREIFERLSTVSDIGHVLIRYKHRECYVVASRRKIKGVTIADVHYMSDRSLFWDRRGLAHVALYRSLGALGLCIDRRFFPNDRIPRLAIRRAARRLFRPAYPDTPPEAVDGLFSEMMMLTI